MFTVVINPRKESYCSSLDVVLHYKIISGNYNCEIMFNQSTLLVKFANKIFILLGQNGTLSIL